MANPFGADRRLADVFGGYEGGVAFWFAALSALELAAARSRERRDAFSSWPEGEWRRFLRDVDDALGLAAIGVGLQEILNDESSSDTPADRRRSVDEVLRRRAREAGVTGTGNKTLP